MNKYIYCTIPFLFLSMTPPALADRCFDLWAERNSIYKLNGYCFSSQLGKTLYGNGDCYTKKVKLSNHDAKEVARLKRAERNLGCKINTRKTFTGYNVNYNQ